jgi:hypothetical protein
MPSSAGDDGHHSGGETLHITLRRRDSSLRHHPTRALTANVSRFAAGTSGQSVTDFVDTALRYGRVTRTGHNAFMVEYGLGRVIGTNIAGSRHFDSSVRPRWHYPDRISVLGRPMTTTLLQQFVEEECTPHVRRLLEVALRSNSSRRFEFNRFEVSIQQEDNSVLLEDVLDATDAGAQRVALADFAAVLAKCSS